MNIICFGDSITEGAEFSKPERWPSVLQSKLDSGQMGRFKVYNRGVGGDTTACGFDRLDTDVLPLLPGLLLVQFGFNDANVRDWAVVPRVGLQEFKKNLREFHRIACASRGLCVFVMNHTIDAGSGCQGNANSYQDNLAPYNVAIREEARELSAPFIDLPRRMRQWNVSLHAFVAEDGLHLTTTGNHLYADMVFDAFKDILTSPYT